MEKEMVLIILSIILALCVIGMFVCTIELIITDKQIKDLYDRTKNENYQDKVWSWFIEDASKFIYKGWFEFQDGKLVHEWSYGHYKIMVWLPKDGKGVATSSVHTDGYEFNGDTISEAGACVLSSFNAYRSKQLASILLRGLWEKKLYVYGNR